MSNRYFSTIVLSAFIIAGVFACKKDKPEEVKPPITDVKCDEVKGADGIFTEIPNLDFEFWYSGKAVGTGEAYFNPSPSCFWVTPNNSSGNIGSFAKLPVVAFRVGGDSAYSGKYAAMLKTGLGELLGEPKLIASTIASGIFAIDIKDPFNSLQFGMKFIKKPKKVTGYYRYFPIEGDSASAYCYVTKKISGNKLDTLGFGRKLFYDQQDKYAPFEFDVVYKNEEIPDNVVIYFSSSEEGDIFEGQVGNTLFIDEVKVSY